MKKAITIITTLVMIAMVALVGGVEINTSEPTTESTVKGNVTADVETGGADYEDAEAFVVGERKDDGYDAIDKPIDR